MKKALTYIFILVVSVSTAQTTTNTYDNRNQLIQQGNGISAQIWNIDDNQNFTSQKVTNSSATIDLQNTGLSVSPITIVAGNNITTGVSIFNSGGGAANSSLFKYYLSTNTTLDVNDVQLDSANINGLAGGNTYGLGSKQLTIPPTTTNGVYYILFVVDALNQVAESNENNNISYQQITVASCTNTIAINAVATPANCGTNNGVITLNPTGGTSPYQYSIDGGATYTTYNIFNSLAPTTDSVKVKDVTGCTATQNVTIANAGNVTPVASFTPTISTNTVSLNNNSTGGTNYLWNFGDGNTLNTLHAAHTYSSQGKYNVCLTASNGCASVQNCQQITINSSTATQSQVFAKVYKYYGEILLNEICMSQVDSGFMIAGSTGIYPIYGKIDINGDVIWSKEIAASTFNSVSAYQIKAFGNGYLIQIGNNTLIMIDENGNSMWTRQIANANLVKIFPSAAIVCGTASNTNTLLVQSINTSGGQNWSKQYQYQIYGTSSNDSTDLEISGDITQMGSNAYGIAITVRKKYISFTAQDYYSYFDPLIIKIDNAGNHQWSKTAGQVNYDAPRQIFYDNVTNKLVVISESYYQSSYGGFMAMFAATNGASSWTKFYPAGVPYYLGTVNTLNGYLYKCGLGNNLFSMDAYLYPTINRLIDTTSSTVHFTHGFTTKEKGFIGFFSTIVNNTNAAGIHRGIIKLDSAINGTLCKPGKPTSVPSTSSISINSTQIYTPNVTNYSASISAPSYTASVGAVYDSLLCQQQANLCNLATKLTSSKLAPCFGEQVTITRPPQYGTSTWYVNNNIVCTNCASYSYTFNQIGTYKIKMKIADYYCVDSSELTYSITPSITATSNTTPTLCGGATGTITLQASGGVPPYQYSIDTANTYLSSNTFNNLDSGYYVIKVKDDYGCIKTVLDTVDRVMSNITLQATTIHPSCNGNADGAITVQPGGGTSPYSYIWNNSATTNVITGLSQNSYTVTVTDANLCTISQVFSVIDPPLLVFDSILATDDLCLDSVGTVRAIAKGGTPPYAYAWSHGGVDSFQQNLWPDDYVISVFDANGCMMRDTVEIDTASVPSPPPVITPAGIIKLCQGNGITLQSNYTSGIFNWFNNGTQIIGATNDNYYTNVGDTFTIAYTNLDGCTSVSQPSIVIINPLPPIPIISFSNDTLYSSIQDIWYSYQWYNHGNLITGAINYCHKAMQIGSYNVIITDSNSCWASSQAFNVNTLDVDYLYSESKDTIILYPNPTAGDVNIAIHTLHDALIEVMITDILGKKLATYIINPKNSYGYLKTNIAGYASGIYMFTFSRNGKHWQSVRVTKD